MSNTFKNAIDEDKNLKNDLEKLAKKFDEIGKETFGKINHSKLVYDFNEHKLIRVDDAEDEDSSTCDECEEENCEACDQDPADEGYYEEDYEDTTTGSGTTMISFHNCNFIFSDPYQTETFIKSIKSNKEPGDVY